MTRWGVLIGSLALVAASCGGDSSSGEPSTPTDTAAAASAPPDTDPPTTVAPADTEPPPTEPPPTEPPATEPAPTDPPPTEPPPTDPPPAEAERPDPCTVWTVADLEAATGLAFTEGVYNESLSVGGQDICDWITAGDPFANAQVLVLAPGLDHLFLRSGTEIAAGPVTDLDIVGADAAHIGVNGQLLGIDIGGGVVMQLAYLPPGGATDTGDQLIQLADAAVANLSS